MHAQGDLVRQRQAYMHDGCRPAGAVVEGESAEDGTEDKRSDLLALVAVHMSHKVEGCVRQDCSSDAEEGDHGEEECTTEECFICQDEDGPEGEIEFPGRWGWDVFLAVLPYDFSGAQIPGCRCQDG